MISMRLSDRLDKLKRRGREPLGAGYGVHGKGDITETGGRSYSALKKEKRQEKRRKRNIKIKKALIEFGKKIEKHAAEQDIEPIRYDPHLNENL